MRLGCVVFHMYRAKLESLYKAEYCDKQGRSAAVGGKAMEGDWILKVLHDRQSEIDSRASPWQHEGVAPE